MYLHIGGDVILPAKKVIGIFPYAEKELSKQTKVFLKEREQDGSCIKIVDDDSVKSIIVTDASTYYSPVSSQTLFRRSNTDALEKLHGDVED
ncbi:extracellular matrix regulator RemB [Shouchella patagoniensis]|uniref:extracellular matrix regulator RemB n=1 Tax=Shouchella patagoniensis TaxID=228576 RepID=UPI0009958832|nr:extracellular matrix/biofilm biosynthesis regulator RemA family protein [Shouchella patagoniensis]